MGLRFRPAALNRVGRAKSFFSTVVADEFKRPEGLEMCNRAILSCKQAVGKRSEALGRDREQQGKA